jgi:hypothetical protein
VVVRVKRRIEENTIGIEGIMEVANEAYARQYGK